MTGSTANNHTFSLPSHNQDILVLGATGRLGTELVQELFEHDSHPRVHVFLRTPSKLSQQDRDKCASVYEGDARSPEDLSRALQESRATTVIFAIGDGDRHHHHHSPEPQSSPSHRHSHHKQQPFEQVRTECATALAQVMGDETRVVLISSTGAGVTGSGSPNHRRPSLSKLLEHAHHSRRHVVLDDHTGQEMALLQHHAAQTWIVRPTKLTSGLSSGKVETFLSDDVKHITHLERRHHHVDRSDLAMYIVDEICEGHGEEFGKTVYITGATTESERSFRRDTWKSERSIKSERNILPNDSF